jgi:hypothetical protein
LPIVRLRGIRRDSFEPVQEDRDMKRKLLVGWGGWGLALLAGGAVWASTVVGLSVEDQARLSRLVVVGEVLNQKGIDHPVNGIETEITLRVTDVLKGSVRRGETVTFHTRGGEVDGEISEAVGEAAFKTGERVLVFIESVDGRLYNLGLSMGVWSVHEDASGGMSFTRALRDGLSIVGEKAVEHGPIGYGDMRSRVLYAGRNPRFDNELLRNRIGGGGE